RPVRPVPGPADAVGRPARDDRRPAVVRRLLQPGAGRSAAPGGAAPRPGPPPAPAERRADRRPPPPGPPPGVDRDRPAVRRAACAYSTSTGELIGARAVLGLAAAVILPLALAVIPVMFTPEERPRAIGVVGGATFLGYPLGPILGGWLLDKFWWGSVFLINVP